MSKGYISAVQSTAPIAYWPLNEGSGLIAYDRSGNGRDGLGVGLTWDGTRHPSGSFVPFLDATNDYYDVYSASLAAAFNMDEFTIMAWIKVANAGVWTDLATRRVCMFLRDASNSITITRIATNNTMRFNRSGAGVFKFVSVDGFTSTNFLNVAISGSIAGGGLLSAGDLRAYKNGAEVGTPATGNLAATGSGLSATQTVLGAATTTPTEVWHGYKGHVAIWNRPIDDAILALGSSA